MWYLVYNALLLIASPVIVAILLSKPRCRRGLPQRLGSENGLFSLFGLFGAKEPDKPDKPNQPNKPVIWVHAVSLGEVVAVAPVVKELHRRHPEYRFVVSTVTETGREAVEQRLVGVAEHRYAPLDFPWVVSRTVARLRPLLYLFVETELWPNVLRHLHRWGVPTIMVNGRLSSRSFARQQWVLVRSFYRTMVGTLDLCLMQSERDVERIIALGADPKAVRRTGNIKFDQPAPVYSNSRAALGIPESGGLIVAGSTHQGEEELLVEGYRALLSRHPTACLLLAPRHIERAEQVEAMVRRTGLTVRRRSTFPPGEARRDPGSQVIILDTRGELAGLYHEAMVAFVGGTLVPVGGHNLLEPAACGKPVLFGPYTDHCADIADLLLRGGGGWRITQGDLAKTFVRLFDEPEERTRMGRAARSVVDQNRGALQATVEAVESILATTPSRTTSSWSAASYSLTVGR
jgi:3-deoxy-D-manno-octulosonic-acid transferase